MCWQPGRDRDDGNDHEDNGHVGCRVERRDTNEEVRHGSSTGGCSQHAERHSGYSTAECGYEPGPTDITSLSADRQANPELVPPLRHVQAHKAEEADRGEYEGDQRKEREHPDAEAPRGDGSRHDRVHRREPVDQHARIEATSLGLNCRGHPERVTGCPDDQIGRRDSRLQGGIVHVEPHIINPAIANVADRAPHVRATGRRMDGHEDPLTSRILIVPEPPCRALADQRHSRRRGVVLLVEERRALRSLVATCVSILECVWPRRTRVFSRVTGRIARFQGQSQGQSLSHNSFLAVYLQGR